LPNELRGKAQTVLGLIDPLTLGMTTTHEHVLIDFVCMYVPPTDATLKYRGEEQVALHNVGWIRYDPFRNRDNLELMDEDTAIEEIALFGRVGGGTIVDATTFGIGRDPMALARIARATGVNIVMGAGYYVGSVHPEDMKDKTEDVITQQIIDELTVGTDGTDIKAGIIGELGCSWPLQDNERKVLRAGARAQQETGAGILIHPGRSPEAPFEILKELQSAGADLSRVIMGHLDRTVLEHETLLKLAAQGSMLEYDLFGWETSHYSLGSIDMMNDGERIGYVQLLVENGYTDQLVLAQDVFCKTRIAKYGGYGYGHLIENIVPRLRRRIGDAATETIMVDNPARILTFI